MPPIDLGCGEPALRLADGSVCCAPDGLQLPLWHDLVFADDEGKWHPEHADSHTIRFERAVHTHWEGRIEITIRQILWDYLEIHCSPWPVANDWAPLRAWFLQWFDSDDVKEPDAEGLSGVVHFISDPETLNDGFRLFVDLGSAPLDALGDLLNRLAELGVARCSFGSGSKSEI